MSQPLPADTVSVQPLADSPPLSQTAEPWCGRRFFQLMLPPTPLWVLGSGAFFLYWVVPLILTSIQGTLASQGSIIRWVGQSAPWAQSYRLYSWLLHDQKIQEGMAYLNDKTHFMFSIIGIFGALIAFYVLRRIDIIVNDLCRDGIPNKNINKTIAIYQTFQTKANHWFWQICSMASAFSTFLVFIHFTKSRALDFWWGNLKFGPAGIYFALIASIMIFYGTQVLFLTGMASAMLTRLFSEEPDLRPFHPDGANGLDPIGRLIMLLWVLAFAIGAELFVTLRLGYLGIEHLPLSWGLALLGMFTIPVLALAPLFSCLRSLNKARMASAGQLEPLLNSLLAQARNEMQQGDSEHARATLSALGDIHGVQERIANANVWPFSPRALTAVLLLYLGQLYLTLKGIFG